MDKPKITLIGFGSGTSIRDLIFNNEAEINWDFWAQMQY